MMQSCPFWFVLGLNIFVFILQIGVRQTVVVLHTGISKELEFVVLHTGSSQA